jgi:hypothetical protein
MLEEIANLRDQLLEVLEGKIAADEGLVPLTSPQVKYCPGTLFGTLQLLKTLVKVASASAWSIIKYLLVRRKSLLNQSYLQQVRKMSCYGLRYCQNLLTLYLNF